MAQLLLVEDNAAAAALICQYMKALYSDHQITICATATDAFDWAGKHHIDLFILDIQLPDYRGTELGKHKQSWRGRIFLSWMNRLTH